MKKVLLRRDKLLLCWSTASLIILAQSHPVLAEDTETGRHSLILRPPAQSSPETTAEWNLGRSGSSVQPPPSRSLHHRLTKRPATLPSNPVETTSAAQAKPPVGAPAKPIATGPVLPSLLGGVAMPPTRAASVTASAGSPLSATQLPASMLRLLQANPLFSSLLQPLVPVPAPPPSSTTGNATLTWDANTEADLAGYKVHVGTASGTYQYAGSPFTIGKVTNFTVRNLPPNSTYFFAVSAYDTAGNESLLSAEVSKSIF